MKKLTLVIAVLSLFFSSCLEVETPYPTETFPKSSVKSSQRGFIQEGIASWYGPMFNGRRTANGEIYNMFALTAAHKTLPFGTCVKVINLKNGKSVVVRINDRGPFVKGRIIDLSYAAAKVIGLDKMGIAPVKLIKVNCPHRKKNYLIASFKVKDNAYEFLKFLKKRQIKAYVIKAKGYFRVCAPSSQKLLLEKFKIKPQEDVFGYCEH